VIFMVWIKKNNQFLPDISIETLKHLYKKERNAKAKLRLLACIQRKKGKTLDDIAYSLQKPKTTIHDWLKKIESKKLSGCYDIKQKGNNSKITFNQKQELKKILNESPQKQKIPFKLWTTTLVQYIIHKNFGISYTQSAIWKLITKLNFSLKIPRQEHQKANKKAQEKFKKE
jgi:transposase